jgi:hypothetical protein
MDEEIQKYNEYTKLINLGLREGDSDLVNRNVAKRRKIKKSLLKDQSGIDYFLSMLTAEDLELRLDAASNLILIPEYKDRAINVYVEIAAQSIPKLSTRAEFGLKNIIGFSEADSYIKKYKQK